MHDRGMMEWIIGVINDGVTDAEMECEWAHKAKDSGERDSAAMLHSEATKRISGAKEWFEKNREALYDPKNAEAVAKAFLGKWEERLAQVMARMNGFKP